VRQVRAGEPIRTKLPLKRTRCTCSLTGRGLTRQADPGFFEKGNMSNVFTFAVMAAGIAMRFSSDSSWEDNVAGRWVTRSGVAAPG
jgi:hypothetical protein